MLSELPKVPTLMLPSGADLVPSLGGANTQLELTVPKVDASIDGSVDGGIFDDLNIDMQGLGVLAGVVGDIFQNSKDSKYKEEMLAREDERIERDRARQDKFESGMREAWN